MGNQKKFKCPCVELAHPVDGLLRIKEHLQGENEPDVVGDDHVCSMSFLLVEQGPRANGMEKLGAFSCKVIS